MAGAFGEALFKMLVLYIPLILLTLEAWWFWYWSSYGDITSERFYLIESIIVILIFLTVIGVLKGLFFIGFLFIPIPLVVWFLMQKSEAKVDDLNARLQEKVEIERLLEIVDNAREPALLYKALVELGDLYVKKTEYEKAIGCYRQADEISEMNKVKGLPGLSSKIKIAEKENRIKRGEIWVCIECSYDNPGNIAACKNCGNMRDFGKSLKKDVLGQKQEIKKDLLNIIFPVFTIIAGIYLLYFLFWFCAFLSSRMPWWSATPLAIASFALLVFLFLKFIAYVKNTVIPKLLK